MIRLHILLAFILSYVFLVACSDSKQTHYLVIDLNGTWHNTIYISTLDASNSAIIDSASEANGIYTLNTTGWQPGFYTIYVDSINSLPFILEGDSSLVINARRNFLHQATTNDRSTSILWQTHSLQTEMDSLSSDSARFVMRYKADRLHDIAHNSLALIPILHLRFNGQYLYNIISDHQRFDDDARELIQIHPDCRDVKMLSRICESSRHKASFIRKYNCGERAPHFTFVTSLGTNLDNDNFSGQPYVIFFSKDNTPEAEALWQQTAQFRFSDYKVLAHKPDSLSHIFRAGVYEGSFNQSLVNEFLPFQPVAIFVNADGYISRLQLGYPVKQ